MKTPVSDIATSLIADIGGTNARFALVERGGRPDHQRVLPCADFPTLAAAVRHYLDLVEPPRPPAQAALAVATPVTGDQVAMTNHHWAFSVAEVRRSLGLERLLVLNDFTALALSIPHLTAQERHHIGGGAAAARAPIAVIGPGTGLGVSGLVPAGGRYVPLQSEGGHVTYGAASAREGELLAVIAERFGHVSAERLLSGPGLVNLYEAIARVDGYELEPLTPAQVTERALSGRSAACEEALRTFCAMLGTAAGNLVLTLGARGGLYIGGGIVPRLLEYVERSPFRASFERRGRFSAYLAAVPSYVIVAEHPALLGAAAALDHPPEEVGICSIA